MSSSSGALTPEGAARAADMSDSPSRRALNVIGGASVSTE